MGRELDPTAAVAFFGIIGLAVVIGALLFTQMEQWSITWSAWLAAAPPGGAGFSGDKLGYLEKLPSFLVVAYIFVVLAIAAPGAIEIGRRRRR